jgi:predicted small metal-binding protein
LRLPLGRSSQKGRGTGGLVSAATEIPGGFVKQFRCGDVVLGCEWVRRNEDEQELLDEIGVHAREAHGMDEVPPEVVEQIHAAITDV